MNDLCQQKKYVLTVNETSTTTKFNIPKQNKKCNAIF